MPKKVNLSIIIVDYRAKEELARCLASIGKNSGWQIIVVDNNRHNRGFAKASNLGAKKARGEYLLFLNPDTVVAKNSIQLLLGKIKQNKNIGIIAPQLTDSKNKAYRSYSRQPSMLSAPIVFSFINTLLKNNFVSQKYWYKNSSLSKEKNVEAVTGAALMIKKKLFEEIGGFDERFFMYWEDIDLCRRVLATGKLICFYPAAKIMHFGGRSTLGVKTKASKWFKKSRFLFFAKHFGNIYGLLLEIFLRLFESWRFLAILTLAAWYLVNTYR